MEAVKAQTARVEAIRQRTKDYSVVKSRRVSETSTSITASPKPVHESLPKTPVVKSVRRKTVTIQELEKIQKLTGPRSPQAQALVGTRSYSSIPGSSTVPSRLNQLSSIEEVGKDVKTTNESLASEKTKRRDSAKTTKSAFLRRASTVKKRGAPSSARRATMFTKTHSEGEKSRRPSSARRSSENSSFLTPSGRDSIVRGPNTDDSKRSKVRRDSTLNIDHIQRLRRHSVLKSAAYEESANKMVTKPKFRMSEVERMAMQLKESHELIDQLSSQLMPFLNKTKTGKGNRRHSNVVEGVERMASGTEITPSYRLVEIRQLRKRIEMLERDVSEREEMIEHWRQRAEEAKQTLENHKNSDLKVEETLTEFEQQNKELVRMLDELNDRIEEKDHVILSLQSQEKSVAALMKEIQRLEKIAQSGLDAEKTAENLKAALEKAANIEAKYDKLEETNRALSEKVDDMIRKHGTIEAQQKTLDIREAEEEERSRQSAIILEEAKSSAKTLVKSAFDQAENVRAKTEEWVSKSKEDQEKWVADSKKMFEVWADESKKEHEAVVAISKEQHEKWIAESKREHMDMLYEDMACIMREHQNKICQAEEEHSKSLAKRQKEYEEKIALEYEHQRMKMKSQEDSFARKEIDSMNRLEANLEKKVKEHDVMLSIRSDAHAVALQEVSEAHQKQLEEEMAANKQKMSAQYELHLSKMDQEQNESREKLRLDIIEEKRKQQVLIDESKEKIESAQKQMEEKIAKEKRQWEEELSKSREIHAAWVQREMDIHRKNLDDERAKHLTRMNEEEDRKHAQLREDIETRRNNAEKELDEWKQQTKDKHNEWLEASQNTHEQNMLLARNSQNERLQAELRTHTQILNVEKEEHRKLLESIQIMTYKNLEVERDQARKVRVNAGLGGSGGIRQVDADAPGPQNLGLVKQNVLRQSEWNRVKGLSPPRVSPQQPPHSMAFSMERNPPVESLEIQIDVESGGSETLSIKSGDNVKEVVRLFAENFGISRNQYNAIINYVESRFSS